MPTNWRDKYRPDGYFQNNRVDYRVEISTDGNCTYVMHLIMPDGKHEEIRLNSMELIREVVVKLKQRGFDVEELQTMNPMASATDPFSSGINIYDFEITGLNTTFWYVVSKDEVLKQQLYGLAVKKFKTRDGLEFEDQVIIISWDFEKRIYRYMNTEKLTRCRKNLYHLEPWNQILKNYYSHV